MSHELRTPLNAIIGYSEILQEDAAESSQEQLVPDLKKIEGAGRHLLGLINDILDLSKVEAGKMEVFLEEVEISSLLGRGRSHHTTFGRQKRQHARDSRCDRYWQHAHGPHQGEAMPPECSQQWQ